MKSFSPCKPPASKRQTPNSTASFAQQTHWQRSSINILVALPGELKQPFNLYVLVKRFRMILSKEFPVQNGRSYKLTYRVGSAGNDLTDNHARRILERTVAGAAIKQNNHIRVLPLKQ